MVVELIEGTRMFLQLDDGSAVLAVLGAQTDDDLEVEILDDLPGIEPDNIGVEGLLLIDDSGLHRWTATGTVGHGAATATLSLTSPERVVQRRAHQRYGVDLDASVQRLRQGSGGRRQRARIVDLSRGGLRMIAERMEIGDSVQVSFNAGSAPVQVVGRVPLAYGDGQGGTMVHVAFSEPVADDPDDALSAYIDGLAAAG